jgi:hypothetical protein
MFQVAAYGSEADCLAELETLRQSLVQLGYTVVEDAAVLDPEGVEIGRRYRLSAHNEILIWTAGTALAAIEAPDYQTVQQFITDMLGVVGPV